MRLLLDTHAFIWWLAGSDRLPRNARRAIADESNVKLVSAASAWELTTKHRLGKLPGVRAIVDDMAGAIAGEGFQELPISVEDASRAGSLPDPHRDPFDRVIVAQALAHGLVLVSIETLFDRFGVRRLW